MILWPAPRRGNRWFWFWVIGTPLGLGVLAYAVLALLRPESPARPAERRWRGWVGLIGMLLVGVAVTVGLELLRDAVGPLWIPG